jgi:hypothetical protein
MSFSKISYILNLEMQDVAKYNTSTVIHKYTKVETNDKNSKTTHNLHATTQQRKPETKPRQIQSRHHGGN